ncbi:MAG: type II secretion system F family protein [Phycicoccus sp.]|nr:type II secretion system F family protein [Phycicoccus sp.]NMM34781.1 type II secretion system F family protein [Phycicoccus sp.]
MTADRMTVLVMMLTAAAVLAWPRSYPVSRVVQRPVPTGDDPFDGGATGAGRSAGTSSLQTSLQTSVQAAEVAGVIDLLALTLRGGVGLVEALEAVADRVGGLLGRHLQTVAAARRWGVDDATAWASVPSAWQPAARALRMAATAGVPPADVLARAAEEMRRAEQQRLEVATATLGIRIVLPLGLAFLPAFVLTTVVPIVLALAKQVLVSQ